MSRRFYADKFAVWMLMALLAFPVRAQVKVYTYPSGKDSIQVMHDYLVSICAVADAAERWLPVTTLRCDVDMHRVQQASWAQWDMGEPVRVRVTNLRDDALLAGTMQTVVRPSVLGVSTIQIDERTVEFVLNRPEYLSVEFNGDRKHNLHLFPERPETEVYTGTEEHCINWQGKNNHDVFIKNARIIYFGPGIHKPKDLPSGEIKIPSNTTVYLAPGAVVRAKLCVDRAKNVRIIGRGILANPLRGVEITYSKNVLVEGITMVNPQHYTVFGGESEDITVRNIKSFSRHGWSDGIDLMCCRDVTIDNIFLRNSDDCIALYNHRWWYWGGSYNIRINRAKLWADVAHPFNFGCHGDDRSKRGEMLRDVLVTDCDVLNEDGDAVFSVRSGDKNRMENIRFENIRIEEIEQGALFSLRVLFSEKYNRAPGNYIRGVSFKDIHFKGDESKLLPSDITHYDAERRVEDITFENVTVNGRLFNPDTEIVQKTSTVDTTH